MRDFPDPLLFAWWWLGRAVCSFRFRTFEAEFARSAGGWGGEEFCDGAGGAGGGGGVEVEEGADVSFVSSGYWIALVDEGQK